MTGHEDPRKAAEALIRHGIGLVIISMGERGLIARSKGFTLQMPALKVPIVDPSGAGDAFCSGAIHGLVKKTRCAPGGMGDMAPELLRDVLLEGAAVGAACVTAVGTTTGVSREIVDRLMEEQGSQILESTTIIEQ